MIGAWKMTASGSNSASSSSVGSMKSVFANRACQGLYVIRRTPTLVASQRVRVEDGRRGMEMDPAAGIYAVLAEIDSPLGPDRHCHAASPFRWRKKRDPALAGQGPYRTRAGVLGRLVPWRDGA